MKRIVWRCEIGRLEFILFSWLMFGLEKGGWRYVLHLGYLTIGWQR